MKFQIGAMSVGDILDRGIKLLFSRLGTFFGIQFLFLLPMFLVQLLLLFASQSNPALAGMVVIVALILFIILQPLGTAAILKVISGEYVGRPVGMGEAIGFALTRFGPLLVTSIMTGLVIFLGILLLIIPGILWSLAYAFVAQIVVLERLSGGEAMSRSASLTTGHRGRIFGVSLLIVVVSLILGMLAGLLEMVLPSAQTQMGQFGPMATGINTTNLIINQSVTFLLNVLIGSYQAICLTLLYFDLRVRKEGYDLELAAENQGTPAEMR